MAFKYGFPYIEPVEGYIPYLVESVGSNMEFVNFTVKGILEVF